MSIDTADVTVVAELDAEVRTFRRRLQDLGSRVERLPKHGETVGYGFVLSDVESCLGELDNILESIGEAPSQVVVA